MKHKEETSERLRELTSQINQLKVQVVDPSLKEQYEELIRKMEEIRDRVQEKYEQMDESSDERDWSQFNTHIYTDLKSFDSAYKEAGAMFRPQP